MLVDLFLLSPGGERHHLRTIETDTGSGAAMILIEGDAVVPATYELLFQVGRYFKAQAAGLDDAAFIDVIPVRFAIADASRTSHLALLASPWSYTVYRG